MSKKPSLAVVGATGAVGTVMLDILSNLLKMGWLVMNKINFTQVKNYLKGHEEAILRQLLPTGKKTGNEYIALNPKRSDKNLGSFRINTMTGKWADFATGDKGGDIISLYAYIKGINQLNAAKELLRLIGRVL